MTVSPQATIEHTRACPVPVQVWVDDQLVATSAKGLQVQPPDGELMLCIPKSDINAEIQAASEVLASQAPAGYVAFNPKHARVVVKLVDDFAADGGEGQRDRTLKRFPAWGDIKDLIDILNVRAVGDGVYEGVNRDHAQRGVVEGSQLLGQALVAAGKHAPGRRAVHASMVFMRAASVSAPVRIALEEHSGGRNFSTLAVKVQQGDKLCASGSLLLDVTAPAVMRHAAQAPSVPGPYESVVYDFAVTGRDLRVVDGAYTGDPDAPVGPPHIDAWMRYRDVPDNPYLHAALLAQFTGHMSIAAAMRPHAGIGQAQAHRTLSTAINAINLSLHSEVRADEWMLYRHLSTFAGDGMTHAECRVHNSDGALLASFTVDAMVRGFSTNRPQDAKNAL